MPNHIQDLNSQTPDLTHDINVQFGNLEISQPACFTMEIDIIDQLPNLEVLKQKDSHA